MHHMTLIEYLKRDGRGAVERLARAAGIARPTVEAARAGRAISLAKASAISAATGGIVSQWSLLGMSPEGVAAVSAAESKRARPARRPVGRVPRAARGAT